LDKSASNRLRAASLAAALLTVGVPAVSTAATTAVPTGSASASSTISLSGTVTDARAERVTNGVITQPASTPVVPGAAVEIDGTVVGHTDAQGGFSFSYPDPSGQALTLTVAAPGFGAYRLTGITSVHNGDTLTVALTKNAQSISDEAAPGQAPSNLATGITPDTTSNCGGYSSNTTPPSTIRVLEYAQHTSTGKPVAGTETGIFSVDFETYVEDVLPDEWISSWSPASLESGAMAVKTYGWYWVNNWRGGSYNGTCYNVDDSIDYMRYVPGSAASSTNSAVSATWGTTMTKSGSIFEASFQATLTGSTGEACGSGLSNYPNTLSQWGSQNCASAGESWKTILSTYYPGVSFSGGERFGTLSMNPTGTDTAFVNTSGQVANDWVGSNGVWAGPALEGGSARDDSPVVEDAADDHVYFIEPNGDVANDWRDSTGAWTGPALIGGTARAGSGLAVSADGKIVVFVNTSGQVVNDWGTSTGWAGPAAIGGTARADSPIVINADRDHVFFIDTSGNVVNDWSSAGGWAGPAGTGGSARAGSGLATNAAGSLVAFVNSSGQVVNDWGTSTGWQGPALMGGTARADSPIVVDANDDHAFFIDTSGNVVNDWRNSSGTWTGPAGVGGTARAGSGLAADSAGNKVAFVDTSDYVANDWGTSTGWQGPALLGGYSR
jgi:hypothetical protein